MNQQVKKAVAEFAHSVGVELRQLLKELPLHIVVITLVVR
jgi:hypothetical protein